MLSIMLKKSKDENLKALDEPLAGSWINAVNPSRKEVKFLIEMGIPKEFINSSLDLAEQPHVDEEDSARLFIFRVPYLSGDELETIPLGIVFTQKYIVTISKKKTKVLEAFMNNPKGFYTTKRTRFLFQIFWMTVRRYLNFLFYIDDMLEEIEDSVMKSLGNREILNVLKIQKALTYFKNATYGNQRVLDKIMMGKLLRLYEQDEDILNDIMIDNRQAIEMIDTYLSITANTMTAYGSIVGNNLNMLMKLLAVLSITLAIPSIIGTLYGMNVPLPFQRHPMTFWAVLLVSIFLMLISFYGLFRLKWF